MKKSLLIVFISILLLKLGMPLPAVASAASGQAAVTMQNPLFRHAPAAGHQAPVLDKGFLQVGEPFIMDDAEDEDANTIFLRRFTLINREWSLFDMADAVESPVNRTKAAPSFFGRISYRYLVQGVLRV
ncbi:MAG: hypothetical protein EOO09_02810 [Chitinophagaceae bacterium]|nr:MAG: hypothetical protein EOO09_02810 [Chitinophagaceae bacterium]